MPPPSSDSPPPPDLLTRRAYGEALLQSVSDLGGPALVTVRNRFVTKAALLGCGGALLAGAGYILLQVFVASRPDDAPLPPWDPVVRFGLLAVALIAVYGGFRAESPREAIAAISIEGLDITWETGEGEATTGATLHIAPEEIKELARIRWVPGRPFLLPALGQTVRVRLYGGAVYLLDLPDPGTDAGEWRDARAASWRRG